MEAFCKENPSDNPYWCKIIWGYCQFQVESMINEHCPIYQMAHGGIPVDDDVPDEFLQKYSFATLYNKSNQIISLGDSAFQGINDPQGGQFAPTLRVPYLRYIGKYTFQDCVWLEELDFSRKTDDEIPILASPTAFMMQDEKTFVNDTFRIKVPSRLYDKWVSSVNWSVLKNHIIGV